MMDVELLRLQVRATLAAQGCDCEVAIEVEDAGDHWDVSSYHQDGCHLVLIRAGVIFRAN